MGDINVQEIIGFHGTKSSSANSIISNNFRIQKPKNTDNHWLGHGIYFYEDYELAEWWAESKIQAHIKKYNIKDTSEVIKAKIVANNIIDLDKPFELKRFSVYCEDIQKDFVRRGIVLDFVMGDNTEKGQMKAAERRRCFLLDNYKNSKNIDVIIYTFTKSNPSYATSKYRKVLEDIGMHFNEKQICVTSVETIVKRCCMKKVNEEFDEVII